MAKRQGDGLKRLEQEYSDGAQVFSNIPGLVVIKLVDSEHNAQKKKRDAVKPYQEPFRCSAGSNADHQGSCHQKIASPLYRNPQLFAGQISPQTGKGSKERIGDSGWVFIEAKGVKCAESQA